MLIVAENIIFLEIRNKIYRVNIQNKRIIYILNEIIETES